MFLDHDVPRHLADVFHRHGHEVELVPEVMPPVADDEEVFALANGQGVSTGPRGVTASQVEGRLCWAERRGRILLRCCQIR